MTRSLQVIGWAIDEYLHADLVRAALSKISDA
jgi:hypothetical protein